MNTIDINEFLDYIICSYRYSFQTVPNKLGNINGIKSEIYSKLFDYCLYLKVSKQKITYYKINQRLNYLWSVIKEKAIVYPTIAEKLSISSKAKSITNMFSSVNNVIYFDLPRHIQVGNLSVLYNLHTFTQEYITKSVVKFDRIHSNLNASSSSLRTIASLVREDLKKLDDNLRHQVYLYRSDTAEVYKPESVSKKDLNKLIVNISKGIEQKIYFPRNEIINCRNCLWKTQCNWNNIND